MKDISKDATKIFKENPTRQSLTYALQSGQDLVVKRNIITTGGII